MRLIPLLMVVLVTMVLLGCDEAATEAEKSPQASASIYDQMNTDGKEGVCVEEMQAYQMTRFDRYDEDGDQIVTVTEFCEGMEDDFDAADANDDDVVTVEEMVAWGGMNGVLHKTEPADGDTDGDGLLERPELARVFVAMHHNADVNKDGKVTREEFMQHSVAIYKNMDEDKNEKLTPGEMYEPTEGFIPARLFKYNGSA